MRLPAPPLLVITDRRQAARPLPDVARAVFQGGCRWLSLREKDLTPAARLALLVELVAVARPFGATVTVHDDIDAAWAAGTGVHMPGSGSPAAARRRLGVGALIGVSAHTGADIARAAAEGADYVTMSPIFPSASKPGYGPALGLDGLAKAVGSAALPVLALGGIGEAEIAPCLAAGAAGVAVMGGVMTSSDPAATVATLISHLPREVAVPGAVAHSRGLHDEEFGNRRMGP